MKLLIFFSGLLCPILCSFVNNSGVNFTVMVMENLMVDGDFTCFGSPETGAARFRCVVLVFDETEVEIYEVGTDKIQMAVETLKVESILGGLPESAISRSNGEIHDLDGSECHKLHYHNTPTKKGANEGRRRLRRIGGQV